MYEDIKIETERLIIRNFNKSDIYQLHRMVNNEAIMKYVPFAKERKLEECEELMKKIVATVNKDNEISKRVLDKMGMCFEYEIEDEAAKDSSYDGELMYSIKRKY